MPQVMSYNDGIECSYDDAKDKKWKPMSKQDRLAIVDEMIAEGTVDRLHGLELKDELLKS